MFRMSYEYDGRVNGQDFMTYNIDIPRAGNPRSQILMDAAPSRIFTKLIANTKKFGQIVGYLEADFLGTGRTLRLRHAYVSFLGFTFGQTTSGFIDAAAYAPSVDQNGSIASSFQRQPLANYVLNLKNGLSLSAGVEQPNYSGKTESNVCYVSQPAIPDFPLWIQYKHEKSHIRLSSILRSIEYKNQVKNIHRGVFGYGLKLSGIWNIVKPLSFYYQGTYGKGISTYLMDVAGAGLDILPDPNHPGKMKPVKGMSLYGGFKFNYLPNLHSSLVYAYERIYPNKQYVMSQNNGEGFYNYANDVSCNLIWELMPSMSTGIEYWWGKRTNYDGKSGAANRIYAMIRYNF